MRVCYRRCFVWFVTFDPRSFPLLTMLPFDSRPDKMSPSIPPESGVLSSHQAPPSTFGVVIQTILLFPTSSIGMVGWTGGVDDEDELRDAGAQGLDPLLNQRCHRVLCLRGPERRGGGGTRAAAAEAGVPRRGTVMERHGGLGSPATQGVASGSVGENHLQKNSAPFQSETRRAHRQDHFARIHRDEFELPDHSTLLIADHFQTFGII